MAYDKRKQLFENLKMLVTSEYEEFFRILKRNNEPYTENSNGIFFDLSIVSEETFLHIKEYLHFCLRTRQEHEQRLKTLEDIRFQYEHYVNEETEDASEDVEESKN